MLAALENIKMLRLIFLPDDTLFTFILFCLSFWKKNNLVYPKFLTNITIIRKMVPNFVTILGTF